MLGQMAPRLAVERIPHGAPVDTSLVSQLGTRDTIDRVAPATRQYQRHRQLSGMVLLTPPVATLGSHISHVRSVSAEPEMPAPLVQYARHLIRPEVIGTATRRLVARVIDLPVARDRTPARQTPGRVCRQFACVPVGNDAVARSRSTCLPTPALPTRIQPSGDTWGERFTARMASATGCTAEPAAGRVRDASRRYLKLLTALRAVAHNDGEPTVCCRTATATESSAAACHNARSFLERLLALLTNTGNCGSVGVHADAPYRCATPREYTTTRRGTLVPNYTAGGHTMANYVPTWRGRP